MRSAEDFPRPIAAPNAVGNNFNVAEDTEEPWFVCELRASKGEAWFDLASLKLRRR